MSWFKENKFLGGLIVITVALAAVIIFFGFKIQGTLDERIGEIESKESSLKDMKGLDPYPTIQSAKEKTESLKTLVEEANKMQAQFMAFRPENIAPIPVNEFSARLKEKHAAIDELFEGKIALPESFYLGFETYSAALPTEGSTGELAYQLDAIDWLFREMEAARITEVANFVRQQIPSERGEAWGAAPKSASSSRSGRSRGGRGAKAPRGGGKLSVAHRMPVEFVFRGPESSMVKVLTAMADSDQYFFEVRLARTKNESPIPTEPRSARGAAAPEELESDAGFGDIVEDDGDAAPAENVVSEQILERVAGGDDITVYLKADLLLFTDDQKFPVIK